jgi:hypothetical protein
MPNSAVTAVSEVAGRALSTITHGLAKLRPAAKPLHPEGALYAGRLLRSRCDEPTAVPWLDEAGEDDVMVRLSRAVGLPGSLPDIHGLALRLRTEQGGYGDLLLASTGWDPLTRHVLLPGWSAARPLTTLLPYKSPVGPIVIGARATGERRYGLWWARVGRGWREIGELVLDEPLPADQDVSFDPVLNVLPGLEQYGWVVRLRERSYAAARSERGDEPGDGRGD